MSNIFEKLVKITHDNSKNVERPIPTPDIIAITGKGEISTTQKDSNDVQHRQIKTLPMDLVMQNNKLLQVDKREQDIIDSINSGSLIARKKLKLVLDLDGTLIDTSLDPRAKSLMDSKEPELHCLEISKVDNYVKLRRGAIQLVSQMSELYDLNIYTFGNKEYAQKVAHLLDPTDKLFINVVSGRIFPDWSSTPRKHLSRLQPCRKDMTVILDDRNDVWGGSQIFNILQPPRFVFFTQNPVEFIPTIHGPKLVVLVDSSENSTVLSSSPSDKPQDDVLARMTEQLRWIHSEFYKEDGKSSTVDLLDQLRKSTLKGVCLVFGNLSISTAAAEAEASSATKESWDVCYKQKWELCQKHHEYWGRVAKMYGASIETKMNKKTTHLVADNPTKMVTVTNRFFPDMKVVRLDWLKDSVDRLLKQNELEYSLSDCFRITLD
jgi:TFIIF-interacting CTD phosphatase-like protein